MRLEKKLTLQELLKDLENLNNEISSKQNSKFGYINNISLNGINLKKNVTKNGTFFEIPLYPPFSNYLGDLHLSVFEDTGVITKHVTFKTIINGKPVSFYYGKKIENKFKNKIKDHIPKLWKVPNNDPYPDDIKDGLINLYNNIKNFIKVRRTLSTGELSDPKTLPTWGTGSSRDNLTNEQKQYAREFYAQHGVPPPSPMNISNSRAHGIKPKQLF